MYATSGNLLDFNMLRLPPSTLRLQIWSIATVSSVMREVEQLGVQAVHERRRLGDRLERDLVEVRQLRCRPCPCASSSGSSSTVRWSFSLQSPLNLNGPVPIMSLKQLSPSFSCFSAMMPEAAVAVEATPGTTTTARHVDLRRSSGRPTVTSLTLSNTNVNSSGDRLG